MLTLYKTKKHAMRITENEAITKLVSNEETLCVINDLYEIMNNTEEADRIAKENRFAEMRLHVGCGYKREKKIIIIDFIDNYNYRSSYMDEILLEYKAYEKKKIVNDKSETVRLRSIVGTYIYKYLFHFCKNFSEVKVLYDVEVLY